jgi:hypothetical protein
MKTHLIALFLVLSSFGSFGQQANRISAGVSFGLPIDASVGTNEAKSYGFQRVGEHRFGHSASATAEIGYLHFSGRIINFDGTGENQFSMIPVLIGGRFYVKQFFAGIQLGAGIRASSNAYSHMVFAPGVGWSGKRLEAGVRLLAVPQNFGLPEQTLLQRGGYSYLNLHASWYLR